MRKINFLTKTRGKKVIGYINRRGAVSGDKFFRFLPPFLSSKRRRNERRNSIEEAKRVESAIGEEAWAGNRAMRLSSTTIITWWTRCTISTNWTNLWTRRRSSVWNVSIRRSCHWGQYSRRINRGVKSVGILYCAGRGHLLEHWSRYPVSMNWMGSATTALVSNKFYFVFLLI